MSSLLNAITQKVHADPGKSPIKLFLTIFAPMNFILILLLLTNTLGQATFWLPPVLCAAMCWIEWEPHRGRWATAVALSLTALCLLLLSLEEAKQAVAVALTWNRRRSLCSPILSDERYLRGRSSMALSGLLLPG